MDVLWVFLLIIWGIVEGVQFVRKIPFPRRMIAPLICVVCAGGLISLGNAPQEHDGKDAMRFLIGALMVGIFGSFFCGLRLILAKIWNKNAKEDAVQGDQTISTNNVLPWKKIFVSIALGLAGIASIVLVVVGYLKYQHKQEQIALQALEDAVVVTAYIPKDGCTESYPYAYQIENKSNKVINRVDFNVLVRKIGFSTILNYQGAYSGLSADKILNPGDVWALCFRLNAAGYPDVLNNVTDRDVEFEIAGKRVNFRGK